MNTPKRTVHHADMKEILPHHFGQIRGLVTSLPDISEIPDVDNYTFWFIQTAAFILGHLHPTEGIAVFYQTDRKKDSALLSKASLIFSAAGLADKKILWHKICYTVPIGKSSLYRPGYSHMVAVGGKKAGSGISTPDIIEAGEKNYPNAMGMNAARVAVEFCKTSAKADVIWDPMCGRGSVLKAANLQKLDAVGIDIDETQVQFAMEI
jgi:hypothetical protein